jgi:signal transduction histidine kinase
LKRLEVREILRLIGPYPYNPYLIFLFSFALYFSRFIPFVTYLPAGPERFRAGGIVILSAATPALFFSMGAVLLRKFRFWSSENTFLYILEIAFFHFLNLLYLPYVYSELISQFGYSKESLFQLTPALFFVSLILVLIAIALMHQAERQISDRLSAATDLVGRLELEREGLIHSDERLRRQTSQFLHDRVQSDLMVVGMALKSISGQSSPEVNEEIERAIHRLEKTRSADLRDLMLILTPNLEAGTLYSALDLLLEQYRNNMEVSLQIDDATEALDSETLLGIFRIVEQAVLNALVHGPADRIQISVNTDSKGITEIVVADDGPGALLEDVSAGVGTAIIDSWVGILKGEREIDSAPGHGYRLQVRFPVG